MANIKISELNPLLTVQDADVIPIVDNAVTKKVTAAILRSYTQGNSVLLTGAQTIAGIKTFTSQLASSVATGTAPFSVASTTKVTNLNADLLDGLSSAAFQGALTLTTTGSSGASTLNTNTLNVPNYTLAGLGGVPYTGATQDVNLGTHDIYSSKYWMYDEPNDNYGSMHFTDGNYHIEDADGHKLLVIEDEFMQIHKTDLIQSNLFTSGLTQTRDHYLPNASGTLALTSDLNAYVPTTRTVSTTSPLAGGGALSSNLTLSIPQANGSVNGYLNSTDWTTFNGKQNAITLTTTGTSGAATLVGSTLNIPNYADTDTGITSLNGLTALTQTFAVGTSGTDFGISSATSTHTFNLPTASATNRGALSSADWTTFNNKASTAALANYLPLAGGTLTGALNGTSANFSLDTTINGITAGKGGGSILTNTAFGVSALALNITGIQNTCVGYQAGAKVNSNRVTAIGHQALTNMTGGGNHIAIGHQAGAFLANGVTAFIGGNTSIFIGNNTYPAAESQTNQIVIGNAAIGIGSNTTVLGNSSTVTTAIYGNLLLGGTTDSGFKLSVNGTARVTGVLTLSSTISNGTNTYTLPSATGTLALTSQIPSVSGTTNYLPKFTGASALGNSIIQENATGIGIGGAANYFKFEVIGATNAKRLGIGTNVYYTNSMDILALSDIGADIPLGISGETIGFYTGAIQRMLIASTGAATFSGQVNIGNPVAAAVAVASTHKVEIVIGGTTYYLLATT
jgi:hypothetical protein